MMTVIMYIGCALFGLLLYSANTDLQVFVSMVCLCLLALGLAIVQALEDSSKDIVKAIREHKG